MNSFDPFAPSPALTDDEFKWLLWAERDRKDRSQPQVVFLRSIRYQIGIVGGVQTITPPPEIVTIDDIDPEQGTLFEQNEWRYKPKPSFSRAITYSHAFAKNYGKSAAIVYRHLQIRQYQERHNATSTRLGKVWVPDGVKRIYEEALPFFGDRQVVLDTIHRLEKEGLLKTRAAKHFLTENEKTGRKDDERLWVHVSNPLDPLAAVVSFDLVDAKLHGIGEAMVLQEFSMVTIGKPDKLDSSGVGYHHIVAKHFAKRLPMHEKTVRAILTSLKEREVFTVHPQHPTYYRLNNRRSGVGKTLEEARAFIAWKRQFFVRE